VEALNEIYSSIANAAPKPLAKHALRTCPCMETEMTMMVLAPAAASLRLPRYRKLWSLERSS